jgi:curved DNA-binding protein CbpA
LNNRFIRRIRSGEIGSIGELKTAFKRLAKETHPDLGGVDAMDEFIRVRSEYEKALSGFEPAGASFDRAEFYARLAALFKRGFPKIPRHDKERLRYEYSLYLVLVQARAWGPGRGAILKDFEEALARAKAVGGRAFDEVLDLILGILEYHEGGSPHARDGLRLQYGIFASGREPERALRDFLDLVVGDMDSGPALRAGPGAGRGKRS